jgi:U6 snRNA-associated Sm-like protein LSm2
MIFFSFFKTLIGQKLTIELKNGVIISGSLISVDQYLNVKLSAISIENPQEHPQLSSLKNCFIRGSVIRYLAAELVLSFTLISSSVSRYIHVPASQVDVELLQDAARKENSSK